MAAPKGGARERLMDAAEILFAARGFDAVSTREITAHSGDTLGTLSYHFGTKDQLFIEVIRRRIDELTEARRRAYERATDRSPDGEPTLDDAIAAVMVPFVDRALRGGEGWAGYTTLLSRMNYQGAPQHYTAVFELIDPVAKEYIGWLRRAVPDVSEAELGYAYQYMIASMIDAASTVVKDRMRRLTDKAYVGRDYEEVISRMLVFVTAGVRALLDVAPIESTRPRTAVKRQKTSSAVSKTVGASKAVQSTK